MNADADPSASLPWSARLGYGVGDFALNLFWQGAGFYLLFFYTDIVGLPNSVAGLVYAIGGLWDAFTDPVMGFLAERTHSRWGAYRPYLLAGSIPLALSFLLLFSAPSGLEGTPLVLFVLLALIFFKTSYTVVSIPYSTLGVRMTEDSNERTRIAGIRMYFGFLGGLGVITLTNFFREHFPDQEAFSLTAIVCGALSVGVFIVCFYGTKTAARRPPNAPVAADLKETAKTLIQNSAFLLILAGIVLVTVANTIIGSTVLYVFEYGFENPKSSNIALTIKTGAPLLTIPLWAFIALRLGKKKSWLIGSGVVLAGLVYLYAGASLTTDQALIAYGIITLGTSSYAVLFWSMLPDTIEYGEHKTGIRNESSIIGSVSSGQKIALAITAFGIGVALDLIGYSAGEPQSKETIDGLMLMVTLLPAIAVALSAALIAFYPISSESHRSLTEELHSRHIG